MMLRELFNGALSSLVPDPQTNPPVVNCQLDPTGRFGFVELRSEELATSAMSLDKVRGPCHSRHPALWHGCYAAGPRVWLIGSLMFRGRVCDCVMFRPIVS